MPHKLSTMQTLNLNTINTVHTDLPNYLGHLLYPARVSVSFTKLRLTFLSGPKVDMRQLLLQNGRTNIRHNTHTQTVSV